MEHMSNIFSTSFAINFAKNLVWLALISFTAKINSLLFFEPPCICDGGDMSPPLLKVMVTNYYSTKSYSTKTTFSAAYYRHLRLHHRLITYEEDRIANYFLNTLDISLTRTSLLVCCIKTFTDDNQ